MEWNSPTDRSLLKGVLNWPGGLRFCTIRVIAVPSEIHRGYKGHDRLSVHKAASASTWIRRARVQFVVLRPFDLIYSDDLLA